MNNLSWLLYGADVLGSLNAVPILGALGLALMALIRLISSAFHRDKWNDKSLYADEINGRERPPLAFPSGRMFSGFLVCVAVSCVLPSRQTVYMIAASEMGEKVAKTEDAKEVFDLLRSKVREVLKPAKP